MVKKRGSVAVGVRKAKFPWKRAKSRKKNFRGSESDYNGENRIEDVEMEIGEGENFRRTQEYQGSKMRERLEIKKEIWKQHKKIGNELQREKDFRGMMLEEQRINLTTVNISTTFSPR